MYRARLTEGDFTKDVAVKLIDKPDDVLLSDLREEARIQAMLRDRAVVNVDPPVPLDEERWALVMEFVDGLSLAEVGKAYGTLPPSVVLEIVVEVARVLEKAWTLPGPDGLPLQLQHCDIKPANIQITPSGEVRLLDFGAATRAHERDLEATTIAGTPGYVAPERIKGMLTATSDVYSLGVTMWKMLTGTRARFSSPRDAADAIDQVAGDDLAMRNALQLAVSMRDLQPERRPMPAEVRAAGLGLLRTMRGPNLHEWASHIEPRRLRQDELTSTTFTLKTPPALVVPPPESSRSLPLVFLGLSMFAALVVALGVLLGGGGVGLLYYGGGEPTPVGAPEGSQLLVIESNPPGAEVYIDDQLVGTTPVMDMVIRDGGYALRMHKGRFDVEDRIDVGAAQPHRYFWEITMGERGLKAR